MSTTPKLTKQLNFNTTYWSLHTTGQHATKCHKDHNKQALHNDPQRNLDNYLEKAEERPDGRNSIATTVWLQNSLPGELNTTSS